jgi:acyl carrier protein
VDHKALPEPDEIRPDLEATYLAPQSDIEQAIATIWQEVLEVEKVGVHDNFFDLGGHSLLMIRVHNELRQSFDKDISIIDLFRYPTIGALASYFGKALDRHSPVQRGHMRAERRKQRRKRREGRTL